jgi:hypothetical protein
MVLRWRPAAAAAGATAGPGRKNPALRLLPRRELPGRWLLSRRELPGRWLLLLLLLLLAAIGGCVLAMGITRCSVGMRPAAPKDHIVSCACKKQTDRPTTSDTVLLAATWCSLRICAADRQAC